MPQVAQILGIGQLLTVSRLEIEADAMAWRIRYRNIIGLLLVTFASQGCSISSIPVSRIFAGAQASASVTGVEDTRYDVGDILVYSNGSYQVVASVGEDEYETVENRGGEFIRYMNSVYPPRRWRRGERWGENIVEPARGRLFPVSRDSFQSFSNRYIYCRDCNGRPRESNSIWWCGVDGEESLTTVMGTFDTYRVNCTQYGGIKGTAWQRFTSFFSPALARTIRTERELYRRKRVRIRDLLGVMPGLERFAASDRTMITEHLQYALENQISGQQSTRIGQLATSLVEVSGTYQNAKGRYCRQYIQILTAAGDDRPYPGVQCRSDNGVWLTPGLR